MRRLGAGKKGLDRLVPDIQRRQNLQARAAAQRVMSEVTAISPNYSGAFRERWLAQPIGIASVEAPIEGGYVPQLQQPKEGTNPERGYSIRNESPYAAQAMDLEPGIFFKPPGQPEPKGRVVDRGIREEGLTMRGEVEDSDYGNSVSTAERDWYELYARNQFPKDVERGARTQR